MLENLQSPAARQSVTPFGKDFASPIPASWLNKDGDYLLFSDPKANTVYKYTPNGNEELELFRMPKGYSGADIAEYFQKPGKRESIEC